MSMSKTQKRTQPPWHVPSSGNTPQLKLYNSLTRQKEVFVPQSGRRVQWYSCGPTVYDAAHMGHARSYISFDILRRILSDYFSYDVFYVMNITDIDDKIIKRARQDFLYQRYADEAHDLTKVISDVKSATSMYEEQMLAQEDPDKKVMQEKILKEVKLALHEAAKESSEAAKEELVQRAKDVLSEWLDFMKGKEVNDNSIFSDLPVKWESSFHEDMEALNVLPADAVTRVSEYIDEIIAYVIKIMENGLAYESNGSVYFDTMKFDQQPGHSYAKLVPEAFGDVKKLQEGEGDLSISEEKLGEKKNPSDFAVWKASKAGEPSWDSPWGKGRPGWHIECSVMASDILGESLDIHTGGYDLKFPHHDNELAQAEAYFDNDHWVRYFLHSGHLTISGCKMSKSLKNFITIKDALKQYSARQLRLAFLFHSWKDTLDYSPQTMDMALNFERTVMEFFLNLKDAVRDLPTTGRASYQKWNAEERKLNKVFQEEQAGIHAALCDNIDTRKALDHMKNIISAFNVYLKEKKAAPSNQLLLNNIASYITKMLRIFGVKEDNSWTSIGNENVTTTIINEDDISQKEKIIMPYVTALVDYRENMRQMARGEIKSQEILKLSDELRDEVLVKLGVRLEDKEGLKPAIKLMNADDIIKEKKLKLMKEEAKLQEKLKRKQEMEERQAEKDAQNKIPPWEYFKSNGLQYSQFDEKGMPTHDDTGKELSKGQLKKLQKHYAAQEKKYQEYLARHPVETTQ